MANPIATSLSNMRNSTTITVSEKLCFNDRFTPDVLMLTTDRPSLKHLCPTV